MPFDDDDDDGYQPSPRSQKVGLKKVSTQKSIFESMPSKPTQEDLDQRVQKMQERATGFKAKAAELAAQFNTVVADKTLPQNKNVFQQELEKELLVKMVRLSQEVNNNVDENEGEGSLIWIILLLQTCFKQRDKINRLEYAVSLLEKKSDPAHLSEFITKEITRVLDSKKKSE